MIGWNDEFEWHDENEGHIARHNVDPYEAEEAATDLDAIGRQVGKNRFGRPRCVFIGKTGDGRILVVVVDRKENHLWRVATARDATPGERKSYRRRTK